VYVLTPGGLFACDVNGQRVWSNDTVKPTYNSKAVISGSLIYVAEMNAVRAFDVSDGHEVWRFTGDRAAPEPGRERFWLSPVVVRDMIYLAEVDWNASVEVEYPRGTPLGFNHSWINADVCQPRERIYALRMTRE
jgi:outer membrane protein assembly factor BamB